MGKGVYSVTNRKERILAKYGNISKMAYLGMSSLSYYQTNNSS